jgi:hypothetical protein
VTPRRLCVRVVHPELDPALPMWGDGQGGGQTDAFEWVGTLAAAGVPFTAGPDAAADDGAGLLLLVDPDAVDVPVAPGRPVLVGPPPAAVSARLDVVRDGLGALVRPDFRGVLALRLDDPGAAVKRHLASWRHDDVSAAAWSMLWDALGVDGRFSIFCCPGWVTAEGAVAPSRQASPAEWEWIDASVARGAADLECHGYTHLHPDLGAWRAAPDRFTNAGWYRELWPPAASAEPPVEVQQAVLAAWQAACGRASALVAPGEGWGCNTVVAAQRAGLRLFNSWGACRLDTPVPTWSVGVGSPYLDQPGPEWFEAGLPVVGYWHDRDMAVHGPGWAPQWLDAWRDCGARRLVAFADWAGAYATPIDAALVDGEVVVRGAPAGWPLRVELAPPTPHNRLSS